MCRDDDRKGFIEITATIGAIAWAAIALGVVCIPILLWTVPEGSASGHAPKPVSIREIWDESGSLVANRPFLRLLSAWFLNGLANGIPAALLFVYLEHGLGAGARHRPLFVLAYFLAAIVAIRLIVRGNDEQYSLHLRTPDNVRPWQFYRTQFNAGPDWKTLDIPFSVFTPYRLDAPLDITHLLRIGLIAIGRAFYADLAVSELGFYR
ncbi:MAG: CIA30 family protein [Hyphomicrobiales bacterium]|nr:CIA30 family protein [Hyphomicrobiales bacterium]